MTDTTLTDLDIDLPRENLEALLPEYVAVRGERDLNAKLADNLGKMIKDWLERHPDDELFSEKGDILAKLQKRNTSVTYDLLSIWEKDRVLFERLLFHGCLKVDPQAVKAAAEQVGGVGRYMFPPGVTYALDVREIKR